MPETSSAFSWKWAERPGISWTKLDCVPSLSVLVTLWCTRLDWITLTKQCTASPAHVSQHFTALTEASREAFYLLTRVRRVCLQPQQDSISETGGGQTRSPLCDDWCRHFLLCWLWAKCISMHFTGHLAQLKIKELSWLLVSWTWFGNVCLKLQ